MAVPGKRLLIATSGTRGDVQPFVALGKHLKSVGYEVCLFTNPEHQEMVEGFHLQFVGNGISFHDFWCSPLAVQANTKNNFLMLLTGAGNMNKARAGESYKVYFSLMKRYRPDLVIAGTQHWIDAIVLPLLLRMPVFLLNLQANFIDPAKAPFGLPSLPFKMNRLTWKITINKYLGDMKQAVAPVLEELEKKPKLDWFPTLDEYMALLGGTTPDPLYFLPYIICKDPSLGGKNPAEPAKIHYTGELVLAPRDCVGKDFGGKDSAALDKFLRWQSKPLVYIGWGSCTVVTPKWMTLFAVRTLREADMPGVVLKGWAELSLEHLEGEADTADLKDFCMRNVFFADTVAHEALFPKCAVIVHHGGAGTTNASLRSGRPTIITPLLYDQFQSAEILKSENAGIGTEHIVKLTPQQLAGYIRTCATDQTIRANAESLGKRLSAKNGLQETTNLIESFIRDKLRTGEYWKLMDEFAAKKREKARACC